MQRSSKKKVVKNQLQQRSEAEELNFSFTPNEINAERKNLDVERVKETNIMSSSSMSKNAV